MSNIGNCCDSSLFSLYMINMYWYRVRYLLGLCICSCFIILSRRTCETFLSLWSCIPFVVRCWCFGFESERNACMYECSFYLTCFKCTYLVFPSSPHWCFLIIFVPFSNSWGEKRVIRLLYWFKWKHYLALSISTRSLSIRYLFRLLSFRFSGSKTCSGAASWASGWISSNFRFMLLFCRSLIFWSLGIYPGRIENSLIPLLQIFHGSNRFFVLSSICFRWSNATTIYLKYWRPYSKRWYWSIIQIKNKSKLISEAICESRSG